jgi:CubicO group peptidase (beta-lactamase class C family)
MKILRNSLIFIIALVAITVAATFTTPFAHLRNFAMWGPHTIYDFRTHPTRVVENGNVPQPWPLDSAYNKREIPKALLDSIEKQNTVAFLVIQDGKLVYERYWNHGQDSLSGSFSAAKSIISLLIGMAIDEGKIKNVDQPVADFLEHFKEGDLQKVRIRDLLTMSSGLSWEESDKGYFSLNAYGYYGDDEGYTVDKMQVKEAPGQLWEYRSGDTQVLGLIVEKVFGRNISTLVSERFAKPMHFEHDALWLLDGAGKHEKAFCCFNGIARDYARFGQLLLNKGTWNGQRIISETYLTEATRPATYLKDPTENNAPVDFYGYQYWILNHPNGLKIPSMNGLFGQYVYIIPEKNTVIVRLGNSQMVKPKHHYQPENFYFVDAGLAVVK